MMGKSFVHFPDKKGKPFRNVRSYEDKNGIHLDWQSGRAVPLQWEILSVVTTDFVSYMMEDKAGNYGLSVVDLQGNTMTAYRYDGKSLTKISRGESGTTVKLFRILEDKGGNIWIGTMKGVLPVRWEDLCQFYGVMVVCASG